MNGWIKLHRKLIDNPIFDNADLLRVWIWCLLKASHKGYNQLVGLTEVELKEGQFVTGRFSGSKELKVNPSTFYKHLKLLEKMQMIELNSNNKMTVVTIVKWAIYQLEETEMYQQNNNKITTKEQQNNTNKNVKNDKNEKNNKYDDFVSLLLPIYPGKKTKADRDKKLPKILKEYGEEELLRCVKRYADSVKDIEKKYILNESTFWNGRYMDYLDANYPETKPVVHQPLKLVIRDNY